MVYEVGKSLLGGIKKMIEQPKQGKKQLRRNTTMVFLFDIIKKNHIYFETIGNRSFDIFRTIENVGRDQLLPMMTMVTMYNTGLK
jgi:hypothetical protein